MSSTDSLVLVKIIGNLKKVPISDFNFMLCFITKVFHGSKRIITMRDILTILRYKKTDVFSKILGQKRRQKIFDC